MFARKANICWIAKRTFSSERDPYSVLGIGKSAPTADIRKAYLKLAKQYHPDTNKDPSAKEKFVEAQNAYDLLSDETKRATFDQYGHGAFDGTGNPSNGAGGFPGGGFPGGFSGFSGFGGSSGGAGFDAQSIFEEFLGGGRTRRSTAQPGEDVATNITISFMDAVKGVKKQIAYQVIKNCDTCAGSGCKPGTSRSKCKSCQGTGQMGIRQGNMQFVASCDNCGGSGKVITDSCRPCGGVGKVRDRAIVDVDIPMGIASDSTLRVSRKGNAPLSGNGAAGDLYITVNVTPSRVFTRSGNDVSVKIKIPIHKAILGGGISIPTLEGSEATIKVQPGTQDGTRLVVRSRGIQSTGQKGDLWAVVHLEVPTSLTKRQRSLINQYAAISDPEYAHLAEELGTKPSETSDGFLRGTIGKIFGKDESQQAAKGS